MQILNSSPSLSGAEVTSVTEVYKVNTISNGSNFRSREESRNDRLREGRRIRENLIQIPKSPIIRPTKIKRKIIAPQWNNQSYVFVFC